MDHWTPNEVIPSSGVTPVELIILYLTDLRSTAGILAWALWLQFPQWPLGVSVAPVVSLLSGFAACEGRNGRKGGGQQLKNHYKEDELIVKKKISKHLTWVTLLPVSS